MTKCYECEKGELKVKKEKYSQYGVIIGKFPAQVCSKCKEIFFSSEITQIIEDKLKEKKLWGLGTKTKIGTSGNSYDIKLNKKLVEFLNIKKGQEIFLEPINKHKIEVIVL